MKKILLLTICTLYLTGCTLTYEIDFNYDNINEHIGVEIDGNIYDIANSVEGDGFYLEKELIEDGIPSLKEFKDYYLKNIRITQGKSFIDLNYQYQYDNYKNSYLLDRCFEKSYVENNEDSIYISLGGNFKCFKDDDVKIKVSSTYDIVKHNANDYKDGYYIWDIKMSDPENKIELYISKELTEDKINISTILKIILFIIFLVLGLTIFVLKNKNNT